MKKLLASVLLLIPMSAFAQNAAVNGFCNQGGVPAQTQGLPSTNYLQGVVPSCQVTVYQTGTTTLATLYSDISGTPLANPFTANTLGSIAPGQFLFYAATGNALDVFGSGGNPPNVYAQSTPLLIGVFPGGGGGGGGGVNNIFATPPITVDNTTGNVTIACPTCSTNTTSGNPPHVPVWTTAANLGNSALSDDGTNISSAEPYLLPILLTPTIGLDPTNPSISAIKFAKAGTANNPIYYGNGLNLYAVGATDSVNIGANQLNFPIATFSNFSGGSLNILNNSVSGGGAFIDLTPSQLGNIVAASSGIQVNSFALTVTGCTASTPSAGLATCLAANANQYLKVNMPLTGSTFANSCFNANYKVQGAPNAPTSTTFVVNSSCTGTIAGGVVSGAAAASLWVDTAGITHLSDTWGGNPGFDLMSWSTTLATLNTPLAITGTGAGNIAMAFGTAPSTTAGSVTWSAPATGTAYILEPPSTIPTDTHCVNWSVTGSIAKFGDAGSACGGSGGFPITLGSTSIAASSTTTAVTGLSVNGVTLNAAGSSSLFLNQAGGYTAPAGGGSPGGSNTQLQYNNSGAFGGTAGITFDNTKAGNMAWAGTETSTSLTTRGALVSNTNAVNIATETALAQGSNGVIDGMTVALSNSQFFTPNAPELNGIDAVVVNSGSALSGLLPMVAVRGQCRAATGSGACWGLLGSSNDTASQSNTEMWGAELDLNVLNASTQIIGVSVGGAMSAQPTIAQGFKLLAPQGGVAFWKQGFLAVAGATGTNPAFEAGPVAATGSALASQSYAFDSVVSSTVQQSTIKADNTGAFVLTPFASLTNITGAVATTSDITDGGQSGAGTVCAQLTSTGQLTRAGGACGLSTGTVLLAPTATQTINLAGNNAPLNITSTSTGTQPIFELTGNGASAGSIFKVSTTGGGGSGDAVLQGWDFLNSAQEILNVNGGILFAGGSGEMDIFSTGFASGVRAMADGTARLNGGGGSVYSLISYPDGTNTLDTFSAAGTALPTCNSGEKGHMATVSDATSPTYNGTYTSGGAVTILVICDGTNWKTI